MRVSEIANGTRAKEVRALGVATQAPIAHTHLLKGAVLIVHRLRAHGVRASHVRKRAREAPVARYKTNATRNRPTAAWAHRSQPGWRAGAGGADSLLKPSV